MDFMKLYSCKLAPAIEIEIESHDKRNLSNVLLSGWSQYT